MNNLVKAITRLNTTKFADQKNDQIMKVKASERVNVGIYISFLDHVTQFEKLNQVTKYFKNKNLNVLLSNVATD